MDSNTDERHPNRLISEKSPYLLQHAYNPVDWHPWGQPAFQLAESENKPIFLSIGYSTCHWCHVMEEESFEDPEIAKLMNETFICIKVYREERPDIDNIFMRICQLIKGNCGWPLNIVTTPDKKPFFAATYIPKESRYGLVGMKDLIPHIKRYWESSRDEIVNRSIEIMNILQKIERTSINKKELREETLNLAYNQLEMLFDEENGGFGNFPKFPSPQKLSLLLRYWKRTGKKQALQMVEKTLESMYKGGIYDQIGFGFHRYSTDSKWIVPHFEKMLYDQAMLSLIYTEAYQVTGNEEYARIVQETLNYVLRDMTDEEGGFYSAEDADSEGEEGKYYLWTEEEIREILTQKEADLIIKIYNISKEGNFFEESTKRKTGKNILHIRKSTKDIANTMGLDIKVMHSLYERGRHKLFNHRLNRIHPDKDDKILTDLNGLMIAALSKAAQVLDEKKYLYAAKKASDFIIANMLDSNGQLFHRYREGESVIPGFLNDYAFFIFGLLELYETTFEPKYIRHAITLTEYTISHFWDSEEGGFYFTADNAEEILVRRKEYYDGAIPSGNSIFTLTLLRLARIIMRTEYEVKALQNIKAFSDKISDTPSNFSQMLISLDFLLGPSYEIVVVGDRDNPDTEEIIQTLRRQFIPNKVVIFKPKDEMSEIIRYSEFTSRLHCLDDKTTVYICQNYRCDLPTTNVNRMLGLLS